MGDGISGGSRIFPRGVRQLPKVLLFFNFFCRKLHKNERIWTPRGACVPGAPLDLSMGMAPGEGSMVPGYGSPYAGSAHPIGMHSCCLMHCCDYCE